MKRWNFLAALALAILAFAAAPIEAAQAPVRLAVPNDRVSVYTEPTLKLDISDLLVSCPARGAELYIDKDLVAELPDTGTYSISIPAGNHYLEVTGPGYRVLGLWLLFKEKTLYYVDFRPLRITGYLALEVEPSDATVMVDGSPVEGPLTELAAGSHSVSARRFGYVERSLDVTLSENATSYLSIKLEKADFTVSRLAFGRESFNPRNAGAAGRDSLDFLASSYGSAQAEIRSQSGSVVASLDFPAIDSWAQSRSWDGRGSDGAPLPDGLYTAYFVASPAAGIEAKAGSGQELDSEGRIHAKASLIIDSALVLHPYGTASALSGLLFMPDSLPQSAGSLAAEVFWFAPWGEPQASAIGLSASVSLGGLAGISANAATETGDKPTNGADLAISALLPLFGDGTSLASGGFLARGAYSSSSSPSLPGAGSCVEASLPLSLRLGQLSLSLSPGALVDLSGAPAYLGLARGALGLEGSSYRIGLSGELPLAFSTGGASPQWPARAALEGRLLIGSSPFVAAAYLASELDPAASPRLSLGIGLGLLF